MTFRPHFVVACSLLGLVVACSAAPTETTSSDQDALLVSLPPRPVPAWPVADPTYCGSYIVSCSVTEWNYFYSIDPLQRLGCTPPLHLEWQSPYVNGSGEALYSLCYDAPDVRAQLTVIDTPICFRCLPRPPAGQVYVIAYPLPEKPNCPSGCPTPGPTHTSGSHS